MTIAEATASSTEVQIAQLNEKVDRLTEILEAQERRQQELEELKQDLIPIANQAIHLSIDELAEVSPEFQVEDLLYLVKRLLRSTDLLIRMLDQMEALSSLGDEAELLGKQVLSQSVQALDRFERKGYFAFAQGGWYILDQIVEEFDEEDVIALGDNIVTILQTVRNLTQPEIMNLTNRAVAAIQPAGAAEVEPLSTWGLLRELGNPQVRQGLARMLEMLKALSDQQPQSKPAEDHGTNGN